MAGEKSVPLRDLVEDQRVCIFPMIVEVDKDIRNLPCSTSSGRSIATTDRPKLQSGVMLWILRYCRDEDTGRKAVRVCRVDAWHVEFPLVLSEPLMLYPRSYANIAHILGTSKAPKMDLSDLAKLLHDTPEEPVFAVTGDEQERKGERILIHASKKVRGYLAKGRKRQLVIPVDFKGMFHKGPETSTHVSMTQKKHFQQIIS